MAKPTDDLARLSPRATELLNELRRASSLREKLVGRTEHDVAVLNELNDAPEARMIPWLLDTAFGKPDAVRQAAAGIIDAALARTPVRALSRLEDECRRSAWYSNPVTSAWYALRPVQLSPFRSSGSAEVGVAAVASFHPNGYVREAAVIWLGTLGARALPFLLLRLNDWVDQVAARSLEAVQARLVGEQADVLIDCLPLLASLERTQRRDHRNVIDRVYAVLRAPAQRDALGRGRRSTDRLIRRVCFRLALESPGTAILDVFRESHDDPDPAVRLAAVRATVASVGDDQLEAVMVAAWTDVFASVRRVALDVTATRLEASRALVWLERGLIDESRSVREVSRYHIARLRLPINVIQHYVDTLGRSLRPRALATALAALREVGRPEHAGLALGFLGHDRPIVRRAAIRAVAALDATRHLDRLVAMLDDPSPTVANAAAESLRPHAGAIGMDVLLAVVRSAPRSHNRLAAASLTLGLGKWNSLLALLAAARDSDERLRASVDRWLRDWLDRQNRAYTQPAPVQLDAIARALAENGARLEHRTREEIERTVAYWSPR